MAPPPSEDPRSSGPDAEAEAPAVPATGSLRPLALALLLAALVVVPRSMATAVAHSSAYDDPLHIAYGLSYLSGTAASDLAEGRLFFNDPPAGNGLLMIPLAAANILWGRPLADADLYGHPLGRDALVALIAAWKALLYLPMVGVAFAWCRGLYGARAGWLAAALLVVEPTFAAHIPIPAIDVLGVEGIVVACFVARRFVARPTAGRAVALGVATGAAMMIKHTAVILPGVIGLMAIVEWGVRPLLERTGWRPLAGRLGMSALAAAVAIFTIWALTLFDVSTRPWPDAPAGAGASGIGSRRGSASPCPGASMPGRSSPRWPTTARGTTATSSASGGRPGGGTTSRS